MRKSPETHVVSESHPRLARVLRPIAKVALVSSLALGIASDTVSADTVVVNHPSEAISSDVISVMTANVHGWESPNPGESTGKRLGATIDKHQIDITCAQEVTEGPELTKRFGQDNGVFSATKRDLRGRRTGNAIFSSAPIELEEVIELPNSVTDEPREVLIARVKTGRGWLRVATLHLSVDPIESMRQLRAFDRSMEHPVDILCGDFNQKEPRLLASSARLSSPSLSTLLAYTERSAKLGTFPSHRPERGIDHIFTSCSSTSDIMEATSLKHFIASDHLAVSAQIDIENCPSLEQAGK